MDKTFKGWGSGCEEKKRQDYYTAKVVIGEEAMNIVNTYTPQVGLENR